MYKHQTCTRAENCSYININNLCVFVKFVVVTPRSYPLLTSPAQRYTALCRRARRCGCGQCRRQG